MCVCLFYFKDSIEANVENAEVHVQQANQQLSRAAEYQVILTAVNYLITWTFSSVRMCVKERSRDQWGVKLLELLTFKILWKTGQK